MVRANTQKQNAISVVVVCWNNLEDLKRTVASVEAQDFADKEVVIVDGGSDVELVDFAKAHSDLLHSGPDAGVYDAMNTGIDLATGQHLLFLNSGDVFYTNTALSKLMSGVQNPNFDPIRTTLTGSVIYAHCFSDLKWVVRPVFSPRVSLPHMATAVPTQILKNNKFDLRFQILGDLDLWARLQNEGKLDVQIVPEIISVFEYGDGLSTKPENNALKFVERLLIAHKSGQKFTTLLLIKLLVKHLRTEIWTRLPITWQMQIWKRRHGWRNI